MDRNRSPLACYKMLKDLDDQGRRTWATDIRNMLYRYGFGHVWMNQGVRDTTAFINAFYQKVRDCAMQEWNSSRANSSKLKLYNQVKTELGFDRVGKNPGNKLIAQPSGFSWVYPGFSGFCG